MWNFGGKVAFREQLGIARKTKLIGASFFLQH